MWLFDIKFQFQAP